MTVFIVAALCCFSCAAFAQNPSAFTAPPGTYRTSWVGNSFGGDGGPNGQGYWVQNGVDEIEVTPDGTVFAGVGWDEAGRCLGLYKNGKVNRNLVKAEGGKLPDSAWGWGTGNNAVAVTGDKIFVANSGKKLLLFHWTPGDIESVKFDRAIDLPAEAAGLTARGERLAVVYKDEIELRRVRDSAVSGRFPLKDAQDAVFAADGTLWLLAANVVRPYSADGKPKGAALAGLVRPTAVAFDNRGRLIVCENGPRQQILFFDVSGTPREVAAFGVKGGLLAGTSGEVMPHKLFALRGAGTDAAGNLNVALSFGNGPNGNCYLRSFTPDGKLRWSLYNNSFVDTFGFDPATDGATIYSRTGRFDLDLNQKDSGKEATLRAVTLDPVQDAEDARAKSGCSVLVRRPQGRPLFFTIGQYAGGYRIFTSAGPKNSLLRFADRIGPKDKREEWAWYVAENGDIWHGDAPERTIRRYPFRGWKPDGKPDYDWKIPQTFAWPDDFENIRRLIYVPQSDSLYLFGYLKGQEVDSWGVVGKTCRRYNGYLHGDKRIVWTIPMPVNPTGENGKPLSPQGVDIAGDYLFAGMVKPDDGKQYTHILRLSDGGYVGSLAPGPEVGSMAGWQDMPYSVQAFRRKNGEYLILAEEDFRGKNLLYRWTPQ